MNSPVIGLCANCNTGYLSTFCFDFDDEDSPWLLRRRELLFFSPFSPYASSSESSPNPIAFFTDDAARLSQPMLSDVFLSISLSSRFCPVVSAEEEDALKMMISLFSKKFSSESVS